MDSMAKEKRLRDFAAGACSYIKLLDSVAAGMGVMLTLRYSVPFELCVAAKMGAFLTDEALRLIPDLKPLRFGVNIVLGGLAARELGPILGSSPA